MRFWALLNALRNIVGSALVALIAWLILSNSPLWRSDARANPGPKAKPVLDLGAYEVEHQDQHAEAHAHHEPNALHHVIDSKEEIELFTTFGHSIPLPPPIELPIIGKVYFSKFVILELVAALLICVIYIPLGISINRGGIPRGSFANFFEVFLTFVRDQIAKPSIGEHDADRFVPFLWTLFLFILFNNLLGMVPFGGSPTASIYVTGAFALIVFGFMHGSGVAKMGFVHYVASLWPHMDVPFPLGLFIKPLIFVLEWLGVVVRNAVLAVRLFANMFAGHTVLATLLIFIYMARNSGPLLWGGVTFSSVAGIVALSLLELFVAVLQAYIFTFLTALFMGMALHPEH
jgi:F-type H+-transporting ATPase subunit a